ncbi:MAG: cytochrome c oxidase subunit II [Chloroflexi bacterium]|nr:cytochrome c oxidase subunit II [Chloroflexota bacterium]
MSRNKHLVLASILVVIVSAILVVIFLNTNFIPTEAATQAKPIDHLLRLLLGIGGVVFALCMVFLIYSIFAFRHRQWDSAEGPPLEHYSPLEVAWTLIPLAIVLFLAIQGARVLGDISRAMPAELEVKVVAFQWDWRFEYPQYGLESEELRLPVNRPVLLRLSSLDVIHSFWVPAFRTKEDAVPGMVTTLHLTPSRLGSYKVWCAELCGTGHAQMQAPVIVVEPADFETWVKELQK